MLDKVYHDFNITCLHRCYLDACNVTDVLTAAVEYGIEDLKKLCIDFFKSTLTVDTVCEALQAAISYNNSDLKKTCLGFVERNTLVKITRFIHQYCRNVNSININSTIRKYIMLLGEHA